MAKETIGNYKVLKEIGKGGMGNIYAATQPSLNRTVVIKEMSKALAGEAVSRFKREATICANLHHANIVEIYDYFKEGGSSYLVMEYVDGLSLAEIIEKEAPMHPKLAAGIAREVCQALACAHRNGVIHRDIKPRNILVSKDGIVKLTDFGVARDVDAPELTTTGMIIGTPFYMSPEQASGGKVSFQSDLFSLGIVIYEMLTGKKPFGGDNSHGIIAKIVRGKFKSPFWLDPHHSLRLSGLVKKSMKRNAKRRFAGAEEMLHALNGFLGWKGQASIEDTLKAVLVKIEQEKEATTIVKKPRKRKRKESKLGLYFLILLILAIATFLLLTYLNP